MLSSERRVTGKRSALTRAHQPEITEGDRGERWVGGVEAMYAIYTGILCNTW